MEQTEERWFVTYEGNAYGLSLDTSVTVTSLTVSGSTGGLGGNLGTSITVEETLFWLGNRIWPGGGVTSEGLLMIHGGWLGAGTTLTNNNLAIMDGLWRMDGDVTNPLTASWTIDTPSVGGFSGFSAGTFHNNGLLRKIGVDTGDFPITLDNNATGEFRVEQGRAWLRDTLECDGTINVWAGATLDLESECTFGPGALIQGDGTVTLNQFGRTFDFNGTWDVTGLTEMMNGTVNFLDPCVTQDFEMCAGDLTGDLTVNGFAYWREGDMIGPGVTTFNGDALLEAGSNCGSTTGQRLINRTIQLTPGQTATLLRNGPRGVDGAVINIPVGASLEFDIPAGGNMPADPLEATIENDGLILKYNPGGIIVHWLLNNRGLVHITDGRLVFYDSGFIQTAGETRLDGGEISSPVLPLEFQGGRLTGSALIGPSSNTSVNNSSVIAPGFPGGPAGLFHITGTLALLPGSVLEMDLGGLVQGTEYDAITAWVTSPLDGELQLRFAGGFENSATNTDTFVLLEKTSGTALTGAFTNVASGADLETADGLGVFTIHYGTGSPFPADQVTATNFRALCPADLSGDGTVSVIDLLTILASWGTPAGDINGDGNTNVADLLDVLSAWGSCP
jgi:hypothetical protein